eukprot:6198716-Pleurochrysis_carterae.AAC.1
MKLCMLAFLSLSKDLTPCARCVTSSLPKATLSVGSVFPRRSHISVLLLSRSVSMSPHHEPKPTCSPTRVYADACVPAPVLQGFTHSPSYLGCCVMTPAYASLCMLRVSCALEPEAAEDDSSLSSRRVLRLS